MAESSNDGKTKEPWKFQPGNPGGGRPKIPAEVKEAFKAHTMGALEVLVEVMNNKAEKGPARVAAASTILDRAWGKPIQAVDLDPNETGALPSIKIEFVKPDAGNSVP